MSKNKHGDLFNTSLTEIIIILFFVLMLFALFNIDKVKADEDAYVDMESAGTDAAMQTADAGMNNGTVETPGELV